MDPNGSEHVRELRKIAKNLEKNSKFAKFLELFFAKAPTSTSTSTQAIQEKISEMLKTIGFEESKVAFVPVSGLGGGNVKEQEKKAINEQ